MQTQILKVAMMAALLACAVGIAAFARAAYDYQPRKAADVSPAMGYQAR
jgi:hypothetical protein